MKVLDRALDQALRRAAWRAWSPYRRWLPWDDAEQEMWAWWYAEGVHGADPNRAPAEAWRQIHGYCQREKAQRSGYSPDDQYHYSRRVIEALIPETLVPGLPTQVEKDGSPGARTPAGEGGNLAAMIMDVRYALEQLPAADRALVTIDAAADTRTRTRRYNRILDRMVDSLGGPQWTS